MTAPDIAPDISLVLNIHDETPYLRRTLRSCEEAARYAAAAGVTVELVAVLDRPPAATRDWMAAWRSDAFAACNQVEVDHGSLALSRNAGVAAARGRWVATGDADDLISYNFLAEMAAHAARSAPRTILMPAYVAQFGAEYGVVSYYDLEIVTPLLFIQAHPYVSRLFAERSLLAALPYEDVGRDGYAYEDWHFACEALAAGCGFAVAPRTILFYRRRAGSMLAEADRRSVRQIRPSRLFLPSVYRAVAGAAARQAMATDPPQPRPAVTAALDAACNAFRDSGAFAELTFAANAIDPAVDLRALRDGGRWSPAGEPLEAGLLYHAACAELGDAPYTDIVLLPWLGIGGAEKYLMQIMQALAAGPTPARCLVICGEPGPPADGRDRLPPGTALVDLWHLGVPASDHAVDLVTLKLIQALGPGCRLHLKMSIFAHRFVSRFAPVLRGREIVYYRFSDTLYRERGRRYLAASGFGFISDNFAILTRIVTDSESMAAQDRDRFGVAPDKWAPLRARCEPTITTAAAEARARTRHGRLIWASRLDWEKRPELLLAIDDALVRHGLDVAIDIHGGPVLGGIDPARFKGRPHLRYRGGFAGFAALDTACADGLLYTTAFDGLPNVVLEAMAAGLPVIAPACGGLPEAVIPGETGMLLDDDPDEQRLAEAYADAIATLLADAGLRIRLSRNALDLIAERHSPAAHQARVEQIFRGDHGH